MRLEEVVIEVEKVGIETAIIRDENRMDGKDRGYLKNQRAEIKKENMKTICVQVQLELLPEMSVQSIIDILEEMLSSCPKAWNVTLTVESNSECENLNFETSNVRDLWKKIDATLNLTSEPQSAISKGAIVVCEGEDGWNDYLLLHHFSDQERIDRFES